ncbi:hypothetical protein AGR1C_pTi0093 [Agrobacterium fabacearum TT111]|nr:hypothetical protein AGR1C_pTi0093 [Agrobacterium fabacearum TT111]
MFTGSRGATDRLDANHTGVPIWLLAEGVGIEVTG